MDLFVGQASVKGDFLKYAKRFNYIELLAEPQVLPNLKKVATFARDGADSVKFGVTLSPRAWGPGGAAFETYFNKVVKACNPSWLVVRTPPSLRPGSGSERELAAKVETLKRQHPGVTIAWEARGLWEPGAIERVARQLGVVPVWDGLSLPSFSLAEGTHYVRFSALGVAGRVNEGRLERLAEKTHGAEALFVVVEGKGAQRTKQILTALVNDPFAELDDLVGDEFGSEDEDDEGSDDSDESDPSAEDE